MSLHSRSEAIDLESQDLTINAAGDHHPPVHETPRVSSETEADTRDEETEPGLMGLCAFMSDLMNMHCRSFTKQAAFCLITQEQDIVNLWSKIEVATKTGSSDLEDLTPKFQEKMMAYYKFVLLTVQVHALDQPGRKSVGTFRDTCANKIRRGGSDDVEFLNAGPDEWIRIITMDKLEHWIHNIHEYRLGRVILRPFRWRTSEDEDNTYQHFYYSVFYVLLSGVFNALIAAFVGIPVVVQTLGVTTKVGEVITYLTCLLGFSIIAKALLPGLNIALVVTLAYAGILAANMQSD